MRRSDLDSAGGAAEAQPEAVDRLLRAWRGEVEAERVYRQLAERESNARRAEVLREMASAEGGHRRRIEARLAELKGVSMSRSTC